MPFGFVAAAIEGIGDALASISLADVGIGAAIGGASSAIQGGNILEGAALGGLSGGLADVGSFELSGVGSQIGNALGVDDPNSFLGGISNSLGGNPGLESGGGATITDGTGGAELSATGGGVTGAAPTAGAAAGGGFSSPTSLLSDQNSSVLNQLGTTQNVPGSFTSTPTSLGSLTSPTGDLEGAGAGAVATDTGSASNFTSSLGGGGSSGLPSTGGTGLESGSALTLAQPSSQAVTGLAGVPDSLGVSGGVALPATDSLGVPGGVAPPLSTGGSALADTSSSSLGSQALDFLSNGSNLKYAIPAGELVNTLIQGPQKLPSSAQPLEAGGAVEGPLQQTETQSLNAYNTGTLTAPQQAQIDQYTQQATNQLYQQLASAGVTNPKQDSRYVEGMQTIQQQAESMKQQLLGGDLAAGQNAAEAATKDLTAVSEMQNKADEEYQQAIGDAVQSFATIAGGNSISKLLGG